MATIKELEAQLEYLKEQERIQYVCIKGIGWSYNFELTGSEDGIEQADWLVVVGRAYDRSLR